MAINIIEKNVIKNTRFTYVQPPYDEKNVGTDYVYFTDVYKINFSQGYNYIHLFSSGSFFNGWGVALSEEAINANISEDGSINFYGDGILSPQAHYSLTIAQPMIKTIYLIIRSTHSSNVPPIRIVASNSPVFPFTLTTDTI